MEVGDGIVVSIAQPCCEGVDLEQFIDGLYHVGFNVSSFFPDLVVEGTSEVLGFHEEWAVDFAGLTEVVF